MQKTFWLILMALLLFGCTIQPQQPTGTPDLNNFWPDKNIFDTFKGIDAFTKSGKPISIDLDANTITLGFEYDLNSKTLDLNILADACNAACSAIDADKWSLKQDANQGVFACYCTKAVCRDEESPSQITRYCTDNTKGFLFKTKKA